MATQVWLDTDAVFDSLVVLTEDVLYVANPSEEDAMRMAAEIEAGTPAAQALKDQCTAVMLTELTKVQWNQKADDIDVEWKKDGDKNILFSTREQRDDFASALVERLPNFQSKTVEFGRIRAALRPSCFGIGFSLMTVMFYHAAVAMQAGAEAEISGRRSGIKRLLEMFLDTAGPIGVLVVGGMLVAGMVFWGVKRVGNPPVMTTLKPGKG